MIRILFYFFVILTTFNYTYSNSNIELEELRLLFYSSVENDDNMDEFRNKLSGMFGDYNKKMGAIGTAYWGVYRTLIAKHSFNPYTKLKELKKGLEIMEEAINKDVNNLEIRFLRFSVLHHLPDFLGYNDEKKADASVITELLKNKDYSKLDFKFQKGIAEFMIKSKRIDKQTIENLTNIYLK